jgi:putative zinc finger/helix-turn-helix YgiT family protein
VDQMNERYNMKKDEEDILVCPACESNDVKTELREHIFDYGAGEDAVELKTQVPVRVCGSCKCEYMDFEADEACHEAICLHKKVMTPSQIKALRDFHSYTQGQFSKITRLGEATLSRWERGTVIQNGAYDNFLYLLGFNENIERLSGRDSSALPALIQEETKSVFKKLEPTAELLKKQSEFELCPSSVSGE